MHLNCKLSIIFAIITFLFCLTVWSETTPEGTAWIDAYGYSGCVELTNGTARVVLEPNCGGRVIEYSIGGKNVLWIDPSQNGWTYTPGGRMVGICAGRFDIGPEKTGPPRKALWVGPWKAEIISSRKARLTSVEDDSSGVQLIRIFELDKKSSHLSCTQIIRNISDSVKYYFHWSRTFAEGGGICIVPLSPGSRFPKSYIHYEPMSRPKYMNFRPDDHPNISFRDGYFLLTGPPPFPKFGFDSTIGWMGYITKNDLLFVKKFPVYQDRVYGEMEAITISIWYYKDEKCELEPIGPREMLKPGESAAFTEDWWLLPYDYPTEPKQIDPIAVGKIVERECGDK